MSVFLAGLRVSVKLVFTVDPTYLAHDNTDFKPHVNLSVSAMIFCLYSCLCVVIHINYIVVC